jgi:hypothetical protein
MEISSINYSERRIDEFKNQENNAAAELATDTNQPSNNPVRMGIKGNTSTSEDKLSQLGSSISN